MRRDPAETLRLLCRLRDAEKDAARGRLALASRDLARRDAEEAQTRQTRHRLDRLAETYMARRVATVEPTRDGASVYASLALGALESRRVAANAEIAWRRAEAHRDEAKGAAEAAAERYVGARARAEALGRRRDELERAEARRAAQREDDAVGDAWWAASDRAGRR